MATHFTREQISTTPLVLAQLASVDPKERIRKFIGQKLKPQGPEQIALFERAVEAQTEIEALAEFPFSQQRAHWIEIRNETLMQLGKRRFFPGKARRKPKFESNLPEGHMASFPW